MRTVSSYALAAVVSFGVGFAGARFTRIKTPRSQAAPVTADAATASAVPELAAGSAVASQDRVQAVLALSEKKARGLAEDHALFAALRALDGRELLAGADDFVAFLKRSNGSSDSAAALCEAWIAHWLEVDTPAALRFLGASPLLQELSDVRWGVDSSAETVKGAAFKILARRQPDWTQQYLAGMKAGRKRDVGIYQLLSEVAQQDRAKAQQFLGSFSDGENRPAAVQGYISGVVAADVRAGYDLAAAEPAGPFREQLLEITMRAAAKRSLGTARELLDATDDPALRRKLAERALGLLHSTLGKIRCPSLWKRRSGPRHPRDWNATCGPTRWG